MAVAAVDPPAALGAKDARPTGAVDDDAEVAMEAAYAGVDDGAAVPERPAPEMESDCEGDCETGVGVDTGA